MNKPFDQSLWIFNYNIEFQSVTQLKSLYVGTVLRGLIVHEINERRSFTCPIRPVYKESVYLKL